MKRLLLAFFALSAYAFGLAPVTVTGTVQDTSGNLATSGYVEFDLLPQNQATAYQITGTVLLAPQKGRCGINTVGQVKNAALTGACTVWGNDLIVPGNSLYKVVVAPNNSVANTIQNVIISGTSVDLSNLVQVTPTPLIGTSLPFSPLVTEGLVPGISNIWSLGDAQHYYANLYVNNIFGNPPYALNIFNLNGLELVDGVHYTSLASAVSACGSFLCDVVVTTGQSISSSLVIPATVTLHIFNGGILTVLTGQTLTINGPIVAPNGQIFSLQGSGSVALSSFVPSAPVEWWGAGLSNTATVNTASIQACFNSLAAGICTLQAGTYNTNAALIVTKSNIGLVGSGRGIPNSTLYPTPIASVILANCSGCDILDVTGTSNANTISNVTFKDFTLSRSVTPTGTAKGLSMTWVDEPIVDGVGSQDSIIDFYLKGIASQGGKIENSVAQWGYTGLTEATGNLYGFEIDSTDNSTSNSLRIRHVVVASNYAHNGTSTTYGIFETGSEIHDLHLEHPETALTDHGIYINSTDPTLGPSLDIQIVDPILDSCRIDCFFANEAAGTISVTGGWMNTGTPAVSDVVIQGGSSNLSFVNVTFYCLSNNMVTCFSASNSNLIQLIGNKFPAPSNETNVISFASVTNGVISGNILSGVSTNGIVLDSSTHGIVGLQNNTCGAQYGAITNCIVDNGGNPVQQVPVLFATLPACSAALDGASKPITNSTTATFNAVITGGGANHVLAYCNGTNWTVH